MKTIRRLAILALILISVHIFVPAALAHPLGNFTINHYAGLHVTPEEIAIDYVQDMAEIPAFQEIGVLDANRNGQADPDEAAGYHPAQCESISSDLILRLNGGRLPLTFLSSSVEFPEGQGGLPTLRLACAYKAVIPEGMPKALVVAFENRAGADRLGWREIVVTGEGVSLASLRGDFEATSLSRRLTHYPDDLLTNPLDQRQVAFDVLPSGSQAPAPSSARASGSLPVDRNDAFTRLVLMEEMNLSTFLFALAVSFLWGAMHALTPGHGKTVVGAYLVGSRGTAKHALYLGLTTTITHTAGVFALGLVTLFAARFILPEVLFPWLSLLSGLFVVAIGFNLFFSRLRAVHLKSRNWGVRLPSGRYTSVQLLARPVFGLSRAGDRSHPAFQAVVHRHDSDRHDPASPHGHSHGHDHMHSHHGELSHDPLHGHSHSHLPPGADGTPVSWRSLLALGVSGGLLPCPSALVVLLSAIALDRIGLGMALVLAFSLGLAGVLTGIGLVFVYAGRLFERVPVQSRVARLLPAFSALFIALAGLGIMVKALVEIGVLNL